jgi:hypothetical protein
MLLSCQPILALTLSLRILRIAGSFQAGFWGSNLALPTLMPVVQRQRMTLLVHHLCELVEFRKFPVFRPDYIEYFIQEKTTYSYDAFLCSRV